MNEPTEPVNPGAAFPADGKARARQIAQRLGERHGGPQRQIEHIVRAIGIEQAQALMDEALAIHAADGELTLNGQRPRTAGGIFFRLVRRLGAENETIHRMFMAHPPRRHAAGDSHPPPVVPVT